MRLRDAYRQKHEAQLKELNARLSRAKAKTKQLAADAQIVAYEARYRGMTQSVPARSVTKMGVGSSAWFGGVFT